MARKKIFRVAALNIRIHPHSDELYSRLIVSAFNQRKQVRLSRDQAAMISFLDLSFEQDCIYGVISKFSNIDSNLEWFNDQTLEPARDNEKREIIIPHNLHPNLRAFSFLFYIKRHILFFEHFHDGQEMRASVIKKIFEHIFLSPGLIDEFGQIEVSVISSDENIDEMFAMHRIDKVEISVARPNPDILPGEAQFLERMENINAKVVKEERIAIPGRSIEPDDEMLKLARIASKNGRVNVEGCDKDGKRATASTDEHPAVASEKYNPDDTTGISAFRRAVSEFLRIYL